MKIYHITINPIDYERRIHNQAASAAVAGHSVHMIALGMPGEKSAEQRAHFFLQRLKIPFYKGGALKFLHFNLKLLIVFLKHKPDIIHCHDLWVLPAAVSIILFRKCKLVYDAHEYYAGLEIFTHRHIRKRIWLFLEHLAIKKVDVLITVSEPLAGLYRDKYPDLKRVELIRNLPMQESADREAGVPLPGNNDNKVVLFQGHFRPGRGLENLVRAFAAVSGARLVLIGGGELEEKLKSIVKAEQMEDRVTFMGYLPTSQLIPTTAMADLGIALFEPTSINYAYALPNKFFEYVMAGIPVLASNIETFQDYIDKYNFGLTVNPANIHEITLAIQTMIADEARLQEWRRNAQIAASELNWESEAKKMNRIYEEIFS